MTLRVCDLTTQPVATPARAGDNPFQLSGVSFQVFDGEWMTVVGANGSGKSTLLKALLGHAALSHGSACFDDEGSGNGHVSHGDGCWLARFGYVGQDPDACFVCQTVEDEVSFALCNASLSQDQVQKRASLALERCGIVSLRSRAVAELSGGQKQLVSLAAAVAMQPRVLLLDEPFSMLDEGHRLQMLDIIEDMRHDACIIHVTHRVDDVRRCERVLALESGRAAWCGTVEEFMRAPGFVRRFGLRDQNVAPTCCSYAQRFLHAGWTALGEEPLPRWHAVSSGAASLAAAVESYRPGQVGLFSQFEMRGAIPDVPDFELADVAMHIAPGELVLLAGQPGCGKTTLSCLLAGLFKPQIGSVSLDGSPVEPGEVGIVFQRAEEQLFKPTVLKDVAFGPMNRGMRASKALQWASECLTEVGLDPRVFSQRNPFSLSGGQKRRAAIAGIIALGCGFIIFDEPTVGLDAFGVDALLRLIAKLLEEGCGLVVATHEPQTFFSLASRAYVLEKGRIDGVYVKGEGA